MPPSGESGPGERAARLPREVIVGQHGESLDLSRSTYPWLKYVVVNAKGGDAGGEFTPGQPGYIIVELYDHAPEGQGLPLVVHHALRDGTVACGARDPGQFSMNVMSGVTCAACINREEGR